MKKLVVALSAMAAFTGSAIAADMAPRTYSKAPPPPVAVASWTGCYIAGGGGYGLWNQENTTYDARVAPAVQLTATTTAGGRGYFGTVGAGCDYQMPLGAWNFVVGVFGDYDFASMKGRVSEPWFGAYGTEKLDSQWSVGGRVGVLVTPGLLGYISAGYTEAHFNPITTSALSPRLPRPALISPARPTRAISSERATNTRSTSCPACSGRRNTASRILIPGPTTSPSLQRTPQPGSRSTPTNTSTPFAASWSIASTGVADRWSRGTDLLI